MLEVPRSEHLLGKAHKLEVAAQDLRNEAERHAQAGGFMESTRLRVKANKLSNKADRCTSRAHFLLDEFRARC